MLWTVACSTCKLSEPMRVPSIPFVSALLVLTFGGCRCGDKLRPVPLECETSSDCVTGATCVDATCVPLPDEPVAQTDGGSENPDGLTEEIVACEYRAPAQPFTAEVLWHYEGADPYKGVMMTPVVIDVNGDGTPDVVATFFKEPLPGVVMRVLDGRTGALLWQTTEDDFMITSQVAAGDLSGDGNITIIAMTDRGRSIVAHSAATGERLWVARDANGSPLIFANQYNIGPALVNLDGEGAAEIVVGLRALDANGKLIWDYGLGEGVYGPLTVVADLDGDGRPEITDGYTCVHWNGKACSWTGDGFPGLPAVADFLDAQGIPGQDGFPELVVVNEGELALVDGRTGVIKGRKIKLPGGGNGGAPTVADFDGDGQPEVGIAARSNYTVFKLNPGVPATWSVLWTRSVQDFSSSATGSSVFDFNQDGLAEVVYADETTLHVYNGADGAELLSLPHCSGTIYENPVIVDVDGDGHANIVVPVDCSEGGAVAGITVYRDALDGWAPTRPILEPAHLPRHQRVRRQGPRLRRPGRARERVWTNSSDGEAQLELQQRGSKRAVPPAQQLPAEQHDRANRDQGTGRAPSRAVGRRVEVPGVGDTEGPGGKPGRGGDEAGDEGRVLRGWDPRAPHLGRGTGGNRPGQPGRGRRLLAAAVRPAVAGRGCRVGG